MRPMWKGFMTFGLVTIPVNLYNAIEGREEIHFHLLHAKDRGRIRNKRQCEVCNEQVAWDDIVKGYEYEKDQYVEMSDEDFEKADVGASSTIDIQDFALVTEVDSKYFDRPAYLEPQHGSERSYALLREALKKSGKVGIAKVVLRTREHLACVKPDGDALVLELMHFGDEIRATDELELPDAKMARERELELAERLIEEMTAPFDVTKYRDEYKAKLQEIIAEKTKGKEPEPRGELPRPTRVVDLMAVLQKSLKSRTKTTSEKRTTKHAAKPERVAARRKKTGTRAKGKKAA